MRNTIIRFIVGFSIIPLTIGALAGARYLLDICHISSHHQILFCSTLVGSIIAGLLFAGIE